ncbi:class III lanthionine synthetase LanKC [Streptomyces spororaveus]|uniref:class III lanthionine synthetase LanKC n=1 Tax=Streptomyces spororaveus TaxID=284039 RepID=UPI00207A9188|nr:class III lanthionine synthetase LanKC [Streptomyces spororaveus]MCM9082374.1 class III lanthionine synthetase LanKC [Streptomyces spororaveus]
MEHFLYTFADPRAYDDIARWQAHPDDPRFHRTRKGPVCLADGDDGGTGTEVADGWQQARHGIWTVCRPGPEPLRGQGWKIHVAVTPDTFPGVLDTVARYCFGNGTPFKFLARHEYAWLVNAKYAPRQISGKGIVLYPADERRSREGAEELAALLDGVPGPRILSDLRIGDSVVHVRYGAYARRFCRTPKGGISLALADPEGRLVPDVRSVPFRAPAFVTVPEAFTAPAPGPSGDAGPVPPYRVDKTLHFSNAGGVYLTTHLPTGREVVLKEARPHAGYDLVGADAVTRAGAEYAAMLRFADLPEIPAVYEQFTWQSHVFTAIEYVRGTTLQEWCAANQPYLLRANPFEPPRPEEIRAYRENVEAILDRVRDAVAVIWERGHIFGDLHPGNVMVTPDLDVRLLDLEACVPQDADRRFPGAPGFNDPAKTGRAADEHALRLLELSCYLPLTHLVPMDDAKLRQLLDTARTRFGLSPSWADRIERTCARPGSVRPAEALSTSESTHLDHHLGFESWAAQLTAGLRATMDADRADRLFPGDHTGFSMPPVALATGSAGVLWSLLGTKGVEQDDLVERIADWTFTHGRAAASRLECGLYDSELGAGYVLWRAGRPEQAVELVGTALAKDHADAGLSLFGGLAGVYLAVAELTGAEGLLTDPSYVGRLGAELTDRAGRLLTALRAIDAPDLASYGLMHGVAGIALAVHRHGRATGDRTAVELARGLLEFEFAGYIRCTDGSMQFNEAGRRSLGYLEVGSCGSALVLAELARYEAWNPAGISVPDLIRAAGPELMVQSGLFRGRAGFMAALTTLSRTGYERQADPLVERHARQLGLHEVRLREDELHYPGAGNFKLSGDLRTGSAGVLTGVAHATGRRDTWLPGVG